jgi:DNA processing protein
MFMDGEIKYMLALSMIQAVGSVTARKLISYCGSAENVFREGREKLQRIPGIGEILSSRTSDSGLLERAEKELEFCRRHSINLLGYTSKDYPARLKHCHDAPLILFYRGENVFNRRKILAMVGTRRATEYGIERCQAVVRDLAEGHPDAVIVSGLAYGIDYHSHMAALKNNLKTIAVLGHGLHTIYPAQHKNLAFKIIENGCICSDFASDMQPEPNNFIKRNRIIAGLADAVLIVESGMKGGALITADIAASYNRDVFAVPGRAGDEFSAGCNVLIKTNKASLVEDCRDIEYFLGWDRSMQPGKARQRLLFAELSREEEMIVEELRKHEKISLDELSYKLGWPVSKLSALSLNLEFEGILSILPGNYYRIN